MPHFVLEAMSWSVQLDARWEGFFTTERMMEAVANQAASVRESNPELRLGRLRASGSFNLFRIAEIVAFLLIIALLIQQRLDM